VATAAALLLAQSARAADLRVDLAVGAGHRAQSVTAAESLVAHGGAVSDLALSGLWLGRHLGLAAGLALERFSLSRSDPSANVDVAGASAGAALALRAARGIFEGRLELGYGARAMPLPLVTVSPAGFMGLAGTALTAHGPTATAVLAATGRRYGLELSGDAFPVGMGAHYQGSSVTPRRFGLRMAAHLGHVQTGDLRWAALVTGELAHLSGHGGGVVISGDQAGLGLGVRATWAPPAQAPARLRIVVRGPSGPVRGLEVSAGPPASIEARTDERGECVLEGRRPGPVELHLAGAGWQELDEVVEFPARGEHRVELAVSPANAVVSAVSGVVRSQTGEAVPARVEIVERGARLTTDGAGAFRVELPPGRYTVIISADGWLPQQRRVEARANEESIYNVELRRAP
jgi:hypothetical protein